tara:strand:- start:720 stop:1313 length:594 start_codon:yes stop_codon:yes gene_type:complete
MPNSLPIPWILSNPIYVGEPREAETDQPVGETIETTFALFSDESDVQAWKVEHEETSLVAIDSTPSVDGRELALRYALSDSETSPFAALVREGALDFNRFNVIRFLIRGDAAQRVSVQLRDSKAGEDVRWVRSVYVDTEPREVLIRLQDMRPVAESSPWPPQADEPVALMFVVDTLNTAPATSGVLWIDNIQIEQWD